MNFPNAITPTRRQARFFNRAYDVAQKSSHECPVGCVIVCGNYVVSEGFNQNKTHPIQHRNDRKVNYYTGWANLHAEVDALIKSRNFDLSDCEIYLYRQDKHGNIAKSRPCISCMPALKVAGIKHIFYTINNGFAYERI